MTDFDPFERRLSSSLRIDADLSVHPFEPAWVARLAITDMRRHAGSAGRSERGGRWSGRGRIVLLAAAALLVAGAAAWVGSSPDRLPSLVPPVPAPSPAAGPTSSPADPSADPMTSVPLASLAHVRQIAPQTDRIVWAVTDQAIIRTDDGGDTWTRIAASPAGPAGRVAFNDAVSFVVIDGPAPWTVTSTRDAGATWRTATIDAPAETVLATAGFSDADRGFLTFVSTTDRPDLLAYRTTDGGATWTGPEPGSTAILSRGFNKVQGGTDGTIWLHLGQGDGEPFDDRFAFSTDGGASWIIRRLPMIGPDPTQDLRGPVAMRVGDDGQVAIALDDADSTVIATSLDRGATWQRVRAWDKPVWIDLRSMTAWDVEAADGSGIWSTTDAGTTWRSTTPVPRTFGDGRFATPDVGWAVDGCPTRDDWRWPSDDPACVGRDGLTIVRTTRDGGATWRQVSP